MADTDRAITRFRAATAAQRPIRGILFPIHKSVPP